MGKRRSKVPWGSGQGVRGQAQGAAPTGAPTIAPTKAQRFGWSATQIGVNEYALMMRSDTTWNDIVFMTMDAKPEGIRQLTDHLNATYFTPEGGEL